MRTTSTTISPLVHHAEYLLELMMSVSAVRICTTVRPRSEQALTSICRYRSPAFTRLSLFCAISTNPISSIPETLSLSSVISSLLSDLASLALRFRAIICRYKLSGTSRLISKKILGAAVGVQSSGEHVRGLLIAFYCVHRSLPASHP